MISSSFAHAFKTPPFLMCLKIFKQKLIDRIAKGKNISEKIVKQN